MTMEEKICERDELSLEWKVEGVIDVGGEGGDATVMRWTQEESEQYEVGLKKGDDSIRYDKRV